MLSCFADLLNNCWCTRNAAASVLTITAIVFAAYSATAMSSSFISSSTPLQFAYAQVEQQQDQSAAAPQLQ
jgi:hypothetical protein